jgi:hypothetical protein
MQVLISLLQSLSYYTAFRQPLSCRTYHGHLSSNTVCYLVWFKWHHDLPCACSNQSSKGRWLLCQDWIRRYLSPDVCHWEPYLQRKVHVSVVITLRVHSNKECRLRDREDVVFMIEVSQTGGRHRVDVKIWFAIYVCQIR